MADRGRYVPPAPKTRKPNGEGHLGLRADGRWEYRVKVPGRKTPLSFYSDSATDKDGRVAKRKYREWLKTSGGKAVESVKTVEDWAKVWLTTYLTGRADATIENYERYVNTYVIPAIGKKKLDSVREVSIRQIFASEKVAKLSYSAKNDIKVCLNGIFRTAKRNRLCMENPVDYITLERDQEKPPEVWTLDQVLTLLAYAPTHKWGHYVLGALYTGMREEELCGLMWPDIDFQTGAIPVTRTVVKVKNDDPDALLPPDKNGVVKRRRKYDIKVRSKNKRVHTVVLSPAGLDAFKRFPRSGLYVYCDELGGHITPPLFAHRFAAVLRDLNASLEDEAQRVPMYSPHKARHTYGTYLLDGCSNLRVVQEQLGHAKVSTTEIYTHVDVEARKNNVMKMAY